MAFVIQHLILQPDGRAGVIFGEGNEILHTAVSAVGEHELKGEVERAVLTGRDNVAAVGRLAAVSREDGDGTVFDFPPLGRECVFVGAYPAGIALAVKEQVIPALLFVSREAVWREVYRINTGWKILGLQVFCLYPNVFEIYALTGQGFV